MTTAHEGERIRTRPRHPVVRRVRRLRRRIRHRALASRTGRAVLTRGDRQILVCIGDSHARVFDRIQEGRLLPGTTFDVTWVLGATALGLANPNSRSNALAEFRTALTRVPVDLPVVVILGEIDCGYLLWYRAAREGTDVHREFEQSLQTYTEFLDGLQAEGRTVLVATVPPPTVADYSTWEGLENARRHVTATLEERLSLTRQYNQRLRDWAAAHGAQMVDYEADTLDPATGQVRAELHHPSPLDHHLHPHRLARLVADHLRELGFS